MNYPTTQKVTTTLNKKQAEELFAREAVFISDDVIPQRRVEELFGADASRFVQNPENMGKEINLFACGAAGNITYLTREGYMRAVSYANALMLISCEHSTSEERGVDHG